ncbi:hypothetical protein PMAYCL1PPCAC_00591, partial [Pristionchus mayeri]
LVELQEKLTKTEKERDRVIAIAGGHLANVEQLKKRVAVLEGLVDSKTGIVAASKKEKELENKVNDLTNQLEEQLE